MIIKMMCTFDFNPETNTYTPIGSPEIVKVQPKKAPKIEESSEPQLVREDTKYILNSAAVELLGVQAGDKLNIGYQIVDSINYPVIGSSEVWKTSAGNKLTKSNTVSYRGKANTVLAEYGSIFTFAPYNGHDGLFVLIGDIKQEPVIEDSNVEVPSEIEEDIQDDLPMSEDDFADFDETEDQGNYEINNFKFTF